MDPFQKSIHKIANDRTHGSSFLLNEIIRTFQKHRPERTQIFWAFQELYKIDPAMVIIHHFIRSLQDKIGTDFQKYLRNYIDRWKHVEASVASELMELLPGLDLNVLTHSHSGMIIQVVEILAQKGYHLKIWQTESLPGGEGKIQAETLKKMGLQVALVPDEKLSVTADRINACVLGVDQFDERSFVNKTGSRTIVDLAGEAGFPVFVLGDGRKYVDQIDTTTSATFEVVARAPHVRVVTGDKKKVNR